MRSQIWAALGKNRNAYVGHDDFSDDEDMEADASVLEREELYRFVMFQPPWFTATDILLALRLLDARKRRPWLLSVGMKRRKERNGWRRRGVVIRCVSLVGSRTLSVTPGRLEDFHDSLATQLYKLSAFIFITIHTIISLAHMYSSFFSSRYECYFYGIFYRR